MRLPSLSKKNTQEHMSILYLNCKVIYDGRARSVLNYGNRIFISKPDGSLLIHSGTKREPVNWQPLGCILIAKVEDDLLVIRLILEKTFGSILHVFILL